jgi:adenylate cyclase
MMRLLVVDDEEGVRRSLKKVLEADGYEVILAETGDEAIDIVRRQEVEIVAVICDFRMPGINGLETLIEIGRINPETTRILLTGYATMESAIEAVNAGIDGFLTKPFDNKELRAKVREYILNKRLRHFVSEQVFDELKKEGREISPRRVDVTVLFVDIRGFSALVEEMVPPELADLLNMYYFAPLDNIIFAHNGTLDKHIGDSIMAVFGAPKGYDDDAVRAVMSALDIREKIEEVNQKLSRNGGSIAIGIGIGTGDALAGIFGSPRKKEYTVFGTSVNLASRLERLAERNQILICEETYRRVSEQIDAETLGFVPLKGIGKKQEIYSVTARRRKIP